LIAFALAITVAAAQNVPAPFHEDFESGVVDTKVWTQFISGSAQLRIQSERAAHGRFALEVRNPEPSRQAYALIGASLPESLRSITLGAHTCTSRPEFRRAIPFSLRWDVTEVGKS
jgi:hypothetical protein